MIFPCNRWFVLSLLLACGRAEWFRSSHRFQHISLFTKKSPRSEHPETKSFCRPDYSLSPLAKLSSAHSSLSFLPLITTAPFIHITWKIYIATPHVTWCHQISKRLQWSTLRQLCLIAPFESNQFPSFNLPSLQHFRVLTRLEGRLGFINTNCDTPSRRTE